MTRLYFEGTVASLDRFPHREGAPRPGLALASTPSAREFFLWKCDTVEAYRCDPGLWTSLAAGAGVVPNRSPAPRRIH